MIYQFILPSSKDSFSSVKLRTNTVYLISNLAGGYAEILY